MPDAPPPPQALTLWVIANPTLPYLRLLDRLPSHVRPTVGLQPDAFADAPDPDCLLACSGRGDTLQALWPRVSRARWIHSLYAGLENTLFPELRESPVPFTNAQGVFARSLGEYALTAMLFFAKDLRRLVRQQEAGVWEPFDKEELHGKTLGIVGYGGIGRAAAERARAFGMRILALRRRPDRSTDNRLVDEVLPMSDLDRLLRESDYVLLSAPQTPETIGLIGPAQLAAMKPTGVLINLARGPLVQEAALVEALRERRIRGAALDVFDQEPLPAGHPYYGLDNVLLSPHSADHTATWLDDAMEFFLENFSRWERGEPLKNVVDKGAGY